MVGARVVPTKRGVRLCHRAACCAPLAGKAASAAPHGGPRVPRRIRRLRHLMTWQSGGGCLKHAVRPETVPGQEADQPDVSNGWEAALGVPTGLH